MAVGIAVGQANGFLNCITGGAAPTPPAANYVKLHIGDPGAAGTSNPATETTRKVAVFGTPAAAGVIANTAELEWDNSPANEDYTHFSVWSAVTGGTFLYSGTVTANPVATGDFFVAAIGALQVPFTVAS